MRELTVDWDVSTDDLDVVRRRRGASDGDWQLRLVVEGDAISIRDMRRDEVVPGADVDFALPDGVDVGTVLLDANDPNCILGQLLRSMLDNGGEDAGQVAKFVAVLKRNEDYRQFDYTWVSAEEWFEGTDLPVDAGTTDAGIRRTVADLKQAGW